MTTIRTRRGRLGIPALAVLAVLATGCGTERVGSGGNPGTRTPVAATTTAQGKPVDFPCPGESPTPTPTSSRTASPTAPPTLPLDHYAENNGFKVPIPLRGQARCDGQAAVRRIREALEPLRTGNDYTPASTRGRLTGLGYPAEKLKVYENGSTAVGFLVQAPGMCLSGTMTPNATTAEAFAGYPDHSGCDVPRGGH
ncbi:hypothetical protein [Streptomyces sp. CBMA156]|uniref:hypothetical protein n=1 Tax=Streptomyces sp. CBMA156 TaxID=1930280 RepID=UPI001CB86A2E|nr:hypothetical protein [Streptomyces sp. CBMA156]MBD0672737.1 hypothetical protein [Streptomyces sp. CBMA156]